MRFNNNTNDGAASTGGANEDGSNKYSQTDPSSTPRDSNSPAHNSNSRARMTAHNTQDQELLC